MASDQEKLVRNIKIRFDAVETALKELRDNWVAMKVSKIKNVVRAVRDAITFATLGLSNPTNADEFAEVEDMIGILEGFLTEAERFLSSAEAFEDKKDKNEDRLSAIVEGSDEDGA